MKISTEIKQQALELIKAGSLEKVVEVLKEYLKQNEGCDEAWLMLGNAYRRSEDWKNAMDSYAKAMEINPESPAKDAYNMIVEILNFYDIQRYNV